MRSRNLGSRPAARSASQVSAVRRSCQTMALAIGVPLRSQTIVVSRWLLMPMAATCAAFAPILLSASRAT